MSIETEYYETHHIIPRSMGGTNDASNLIKLTAREHFIAHWLLWRIHKNKEMGFAFYCMQKFKPRYKKFSSIAYEEAKIAKRNGIAANNRLHKSGKKLSAAHIQKMSDARKGKKFNQTHKDKISESLSGKKKSETHRANLSKAFTNYKWPAERNKRCAEAKRGKNNGRARAVVRKIDNEIIERFDTVREALVFIDKNSVKKLPVATFMRYMKKSKQILNSYWEYAQ